jgi:hypothetical protein
MNAGMTREEMEAIVAASDPPLDQMKPYTLMGFTVTRLRTPGRHQYVLTGRTGVEIYRSIYRSRAVYTLINYLETLTPIEKLAYVANGWADAGLSDPVSPTKQH